MFSTPRFLDRFEELVYTRADLMQTPQRADRIVLRHEIEVIAHVRLRKRTGWPN